MSADKPSLSPASVLLNNASNRVDGETSWRQRAISELEKIVQLFSSKQLPDMCAKVLIKSPAKPSSKWSLANQLLMLLAGTEDARGFRQWSEVGRSVSRGSKAIHILGPIRKKIWREKPSGELDNVSNIEEKEFDEVLVGFKTIPVFRFEDTEGRDLPTYKPRKLPPLFEVAEGFGMKVQYERLPVSVYGATDHANKTIILATEDYDTFFHELAHSIHRSFEPKSGHGQEPEAETIAQLVAATLARLYGRPADSFSWSYIAAYAASNNPKQVGRMCMRVLDRTKKVLDLIYACPSTGDQEEHGKPYLNEDHSGDRRHGT